MPTPVRMVQPAGTGSRTTGQVMHRAPPRPRPSSPPDTASTSMPWPPAGRWSPRCGRSPRPRRARGRSSCCRRSTARARRRRVVAGAQDAHLVDLERVGQRDAASRRPAPRAAARRRPHPGVMRQARSASRSSLRIGHERRHVDHRQHGVEVHHGAGLRDVDGDHDLCGLPGREQPTGQQLDRRRRGALAHPDQHDARRETSRSPPSSVAGPVIAVVVAVVELERRRRGTAGDSGTRRGCAPTRAGGPAWPSD